LAKAYWNDTLIAESDDTVIVEGNHYFPRDEILEQFFAPSDHQTVCGWKGTASYFDVTVDGEINRNAAWYYADPKPAAEEIRGRVAFWRGVKVEA
jgi:uncharacterized protein (DUF427 family)